MRPVGVEVFYEVKYDDDVSNKSKSTMMRGSSVLFAFRSESAREAVIEALLKNEIDRGKRNDNSVEILGPGKRRGNFESHERVENRRRVKL